MIIALPARSSVRARVRDLPVPALILLALLVRLAALALVSGAPENADTGAYRLIGSLVLAGRDVYTAPEAATHYPYLPAQLWLSAGALWLHLHAHLPLGALQRLPAVLADSLLAGALARGAARRGIPHAGHIGLAYALNPVAVAVAALHGQFDAIPLLCLVLAWSALPSGRRAGLWLGLGILAKGWPALLLPAIILSLPSRRERARCLGLAALVPLAGCLPYLALFRPPPVALLATVGGYDSTPGWWGLGLVARTVDPGSVDQAAHLSRYLVLAAVAAALWLTRRGPAGRRILASLLAFCLLSAGFGNQYLLWPIPFLLLDADLRAPTRLYVVAAGAGWALYYLGWEYPAAIGAAAPLQGGVDANRALCAVAYAALAWAAVRLGGRVLPDHD